MTHEAAANPWRLDGQRAVITGGGSGIGLAVAREFAALGADMLLVGRDSGKLQQARRTVIEQSPKVQVEVVSADLSGADDRQRVVEAAGSKVSLLINNAGLNIRKRMEDITARGLPLGHRKQPDILFRALPLVAGGIVETTHLQQSSTTRRSPA